MVTVSLDNTLWFAGMVVEAAVLGLLIYRRVWQNLPIFCLYCAWELISDLGLYSILKFFPADYLTTYLVQAILDSVFQLCVLIELAWSVLRPLRASLPRGSLVVVAVLVIVAGAAIWPFTGIHQLASLPLERRGLIQMQQTASILRVLAFLLLAGCSQLLSIGWRDRELQIATGLGFYSIISLAVEMLRSHITMGPQFIHLNRFIVVGNLGSLIYWVYSFAQKKAERREFTPQMEHFLLAVAGSARSTRMALNGGMADRTDKRK